MANNQLSHESLANEFEQNLHIHDSDSKQLLNDVRISFDVPQIEPIRKCDPQVHDHDIREDDDDDDDDEDDDDFDFTFAVTGESDSPVAADRIFQDGQIRTSFPLFDQKLVFGEGSVPNLPVDKVFVESPRHHSPEDGAEDGGVAVGPYCAWSKDSAEGCKKSNSTGFSKLWRFKDKVGRSNSDGRDAFVFLNGQTTSTKKDEKDEKPKKSGGEGPQMTSTKKDEKSKKIDGVKKSEKKAKAAAAAKMSPHEAYLRSKGQSEEERRRSYLPYKPELMGFFTNVNGGLSRNVHPF